MSKSREPAKPFWALVYNRPKSFPWPAHCASPSQMAIAPHNLLPPTKHLVRDPHRRKSNIHCKSKSPKHTGPPHHFLLASQKTKCHKFGNLPRTWLGNKLFLSYNSVLINTDMAHNHGVCFSQLVFCLSEVKNPRTKGRENKNKKKQR